jgi:hypothetical protein
MKYLLRLSVLVGLRVPPRLSTPARPSNRRMTCFVLIFNFCETSAGVKSSASAGRLAAEVDSVRPGATFGMSSLNASDPWVNAQRVEVWGGLAI